MKLKLHASQNKKKDGRDKAIINIKEKQFHYAH